MEDFKAKVDALSLDKALALAAYGESVAAFRYRTLLEKAPLDAQRKTFAEMAAEEQQHHQVAQDLLQKESPGAEFVLSPEDKELVIVGPRTLDLSNEEAFSQAMEYIYESELQTGRFYARFFEITNRTDLKPMLKEMADECFEHAERLKEIPRA